MLRPAIVTQVLEHSTADPEIEGSNPATSHRQDKIAKDKKSLVNTSHSNTGGQAVYP